MGLYSTLTYAFRVDWGDGNQDSYSGTGLTNISHTYQVAGEYGVVINDDFVGCLLYTSPSPRDRTRSRMPSSA